MKLRNGWTDITQKELKRYRETFNLIGLADKKPGPRPGFIETDYVALEHQQKSDTYPKCREKNLGEAQATSILRNMS